MIKSKLLKCLKGEFKILTQIALIINNVYKTNKIPSFGIRT